MNLRWERAARVQRRASICCVHFFEIRYGLELFFLIPTESHGLLSCLCLDCVIWTQPTDLKERKVSDLFASPSTPRISLDNVIPHATVNCAHQSA
ncbi:hypothetical protein OUZ56_013488 [Daphnia magna]|uniref:Uncharacterized protein n=1 Tax=Daphnia magna TaxID=35525 RepID=A0ABQ9Z625_9CRUS|nr:hypothetical protein OUZ56_013488 [Daphnia magna]